MNFFVRDSGNVESGKTIKVTYSTAYELPKNLGSDTVVMFYEPITDPAMSPNDTSLLIKKLKMPVVCL
ncbi:hypothetical protein AGMMS50212_05690 [Spirochaetia bacterium]|nr:hypothetical protein AGMMS50212_05690 [Spirochaetia bacterium]